MAFKLGKENGEIWKENSESLIFKTEYSSTVCYETVWQKQPVKPLQKRHLNASMTAGNSPSAGHVISLLSAIEFCAKGWTRFPCDFESLSYLRGLGADSLHFRFSPLPPPLKSLSKTRENVFPT